MFLQRIIFAFLTCIPPVLSCAQEGNAVIFGLIQNYKNVVEVSDNSDTSPFVINSSDQSFVPDSSGRFSVRLSISRPKFYRIGRNLIYISPGDSLEAWIDYSDAGNARFIGTHSKENEYLKSSLYPKAGSFLQAGTIVKKSIDETVHEVILLANQRKLHLEKYEGISADFRFLEEHRIRLDVLNSLYSLYRYFPMVNKLVGDSLNAFQKNFRNKIDPIAKQYLYPTLDKRFLELEVYRDILPVILSYSDTADAKIGPVNDWLLAKEMFHQMQTSNLQSKAQDFTAVKNLEYRKALIVAYNKLFAANGNSAADLQLINPKDEVSKLSDFKGKVIFIDLWATWCAPCLKEHPYLDSLTQMYGKNSDIVFLSLSIDSDRTSWKRYLEKSKSKPKQYIVPLSSLEPYFVSEIPRTILIDKDFKVLAMRGPLPSSDEVTLLIERALNK